MRDSKHHYLKKTSLFDPDYCQDTHCSCNLNNKRETQLKCCWELNTRCEERVIFTGPNECNLTAYGTIKFECSSSQPEGLISVKFFEGPPEKECLIDCFLVDEGSCTTFVLSDFNTITVTLEKGELPAQGEICINPIFDIR